MLNFDPRWRLEPPADDELHHGAMPGEAVEDFARLVRAIAIGDSRKSVWEHFKRRFSAPAGHEYWRSSDASFAEQDGLDYMRDAAGNCPLFIEAFYDGWTELAERNPTMIPPVLETANRILASRRVGYLLDPPLLATLGEPAPLVQVVVPTATVEEGAREVVLASLESAADLLKRGEYRAAVMESLWLLDTVTTLFSGLSLPEGQVNGVYFTSIIGDLRRLEVGGSLAHVVRWMETMYGYLSAPGGGQIRHGMNLSGDIRLSPNDARLYCNLIRSYVEFLLGEHERLTRGR